MYTNFKKFSNKWLKDNSIPHECIDHLLLGEQIEPYIKTICTKESSIKKPPYHVYFRYKVFNEKPNLRPDASNITQFNNKRSFTNKSNEISKKKSELSEQDYEATL